MVKTYHPSPARYTLPTTVGFNGHDIRKNRLPAYSFGLRLHNRDYIGSPAPNTYALPSTIGGQDWTVERAPAHSIHKKLTTKDYIVSPAPNAYGLQNFKPGQRAPAYTIGARFESIHEIEES